MKGQHYMHDWTLVSLAFDWVTGMVTLNLLNPQSQPVSIVAKNATMFHAPRIQEWGRSVSINAVIGPEDYSIGKQKLQIEMQSGDVIEIIAESFKLPI
jgi:hypothetical protein